MHRRYHHNELTFGQLYAYTENFVLPFSHDEVVHGKGSLLDKMPGDAWQKFANLRLLLTYQMTYPGKKLNFMGNEIAQGREWRIDGELDWWLLEREQHQGMQKPVARPQPPLPRPARPARAGFHVGRFCLDRLPRRRPVGAFLPAARPQWRVRGR